MTTSGPITITAMVASSPDAAWKAYTSPDAITKWNQPSPDWHCPSAEVDLQVGGRHVARMAAKDDSFSFEFGGTYEEVDEPNALTLRLDDGRSSRTTFVSEENGTRVTTVFDPEDTHPIEMQRDGWQAILDSYAAYVKGVTS